MGYLQLFRNSWRTSSFLSILATIPIRVAKHVLFLVGFLLYLCMFFLSYDSFIQKWVGMPLISQKTWAYCVSIAAGICLWLNQEYIRHCWKEKKKYVPVCWSGKSISTGTISGMLMKLRRNLLLKCFLNVDSTSVYTYVCNGMRCPDVNSRPRYLSYDLSQVAVNQYGFSLTRTETPTSNNLLGV